MDLPSNLQLSPTFLCLAALGYVRLYANIMCDSACVVVHGGDQQFIPEGASILPIVFQRYLAAHTSFERFANLTHGRRVGF